MRLRPVLWGLLLDVPPLLCFLACAGSQGDRPENQEPVVLEQGSTEQSPDYFVTDEGDVIYEDSRERVQGADPSAAQNPNFPPLFPGSQRIYPAKEDPALRKSYMTRAPFDAVERFYARFLAYGDENGVGEKEEPTAVNTVSMTDDGRKSTTLFVNEGDGPRGGMKVMLKEFPVQRAVQIVLTTLSATPPGLDPFGIYVSPEEVGEWAEQATDPAGEDEEEGQSSAEDDSTQEEAD